MLKSSNTKEFLDKIYLLKYNYVTDWDLGVCLQYECIRKQIRKPVELNNWIDLRATYRVNKIF